MNEMQELVKGFRKRHGLTQEEAANILGCTKGWICQLEADRGHHERTLWTVQAKIEEYERKEKE